MAKKNSMWKLGFLTCMFSTASIHFLASLALMVYANKGSVVFFSSPDKTLVGTEKTVNTITWILSQPAHTVWNAGLLETVPYYMNWVFFGLNSLLWGFALTFFLGIVFKVNKKKPQARTAS